MKREPTYIQIEMKDADGVHATAVMEVDSWLAFKMEDVEKMEKFKPHTVIAFSVCHSNGVFNWPGRWAG